MSPVEQLALGLQALRFTLREWARGPLWLPFLLPFTLQCVAILLFAFTAHPLLSWVLAPLVARMAGPGALHYPELFRRLPDLVLRADLLVSMTAGALAAGLGTRLFAQVFAGRELRVREAVEEAWRRAPALVIAQLPAPLLLLGVGLAFDHLGQVRLSSLTRGLLPQAQLIVGIGVQALFAYVAALVVLGRLGPAQAWLSLPSTWKRGLLPALVSTVAATFVLLPLQILARQTDPIVARGVPELTAATTALLFASGIVSSWLSTGAVTLVWMSALSGPREEVR